MNFTVFLSVISAIIAGAATPNFTFVVPVSLSGMPAEVQSFGLQCEVADRNPSGYAGTSIGRGITPAWVPISGGAYRGDVQVPVSVDAGQNPANVAFYECYISLNAVIGGRRVSYAGINPPFIPLAKGDPVIRLTPIPAK